MQHIRQNVSRNTPPVLKLPEVRFEPVVHLIKGDIVNLIAETPKRYEERVTFGMSGLIAERISPALWLANMIDQVAQKIGEEHLGARPVLIEAPITAMMHPDTPMACEAAASRSRLLPQEICIEVKDASLCQSRADVTRSIEGLRRRGFRVGVNATQSWSTPLDTSLRLLLDSVRIDSSRLWMDGDLQDRVEAAVSCGMAVIAENARYRDGDELAGLGVELAVRPRVDG